MFKASLDRLTRILGSFVDIYNQVVDPKAKYLGSSFGIDAETYEMFTEEIIRGSSLFAMSVIIKKIDGQLRSLAGLKPWQIISPGSKASGRLIHVQSLHEVSYQKYTEDTILLAEKVTGEEEIPEGVLGIISCTELDCLAHVSVRARNCKVLLVVCYSEAEISKINDFIGNWVILNVINGLVDVKTGVRDDNRDTRSEFVRPDVKKPKDLEQIAISTHEFGEGKTGAKGNNCLFLRQALNEDIGVPRQVALPFRVCEYVLSLQVNSEKLAKITENLEALEKIGLDKEAQKILSTLREIILSLDINDEAEETIKQKLNTIGFENNS